MQRYLISRVLLLLPTILGITLVVSLSVRFLPGNVVDQILADYGGSPELRARLSQQYGLNQGPAQQYLHWVGGITRRDLGTSLISGRPVSQDLKARLPVTLQLGFMGMLVSLLIALPIGVFSAMKQDRLVDYLARSLSIAFLAIPSFWLALMVITYGFAWFSWTPPLRYQSFFSSPVENLKILWVPAVILGMGLSGVVMRLTRGAMLEVLRQDYVRTAWSKGLSQRTIMVRHSFRNAILPVVTVIGLQVPSVVGGTIILESIFSLPGMGSYLLVAVQQRDYPVVQAIVLISACTVVLTNFLVDISYSLIDPRLRNR